MCFYPGAFMYLGKAPPFFLLHNSILLGLCAPARATAGRLLLVLNRAVSTRGRCCRVAVEG